MACEVGNVSVCHRSVILQVSESHSKPAYFMTRAYQRWLTSASQNMHGSASTQSECFMKCLYGEVLGAWHHDQATIKNYPFTVRHFQYSIVTMRTLLKHPRCYKHAWSVVEAVSTHAGSKDSILGAGKEGWGILGLTTTQYILSNWSMERYSFYTIAPHGQVRDVVRLVKV